VQHDLGIGGRLEDRAVLDERAAKGEPVGEVAVVGDRETARAEVGEQRLDVAQDCLARGRVAHVSDRHRTHQTADDVRAVEVVADEAQSPLGVKLLPVVGDDAGRLLAAVLQGVQAERRECRGLGMTDDAEHAAFLAQPVIRGLARAARPGFACNDISPRAVVSHGHLPPKSRACPTTRPHAVIGPRVPDAI